MKHNDINKDEWDACIDLCINALPYAYAWYLDIVADDTWDAIIIDDYKAVFPLPVKKKFLLPFVYQPFFTQQLGLFVTDKKYYDLLPDIINGIPKKFVKIYLHGNTANAGENNAQRITHHLSLQNTYETIFHNYGSAVKKNLKATGSKNYTAVTNISGKIFVQFVKEHVGDKVDVLKEKDFQRLEKLITVCLTKDKGFIRVVMDAEKNILSAVFMLQAHGYLIYLIAASSGAGRKNQTMTFLIDQIIRDFADSQYTFDFEGSMIPGIAHFYKTFGAVEMKFPVFGA
ncbi:MAG: hypothetical protein H7X71_08555 [Chitinophagales bacterium]|nr:hypothetical protein [Chitinophagales bacterium]